MTHSFLGGLGQPPIGSVPKRVRYFLAAICTFGSCPDEDYDHESSNSQVLQLQPVPKFDVFLKLQYLTSSTCVLIQSVDTMDDIAQIYTRLPNQQQGDCQHTGLLSYI